MKYFRGLKISLVAKLVLAFVLVAVIPMLVASKITTELIADVVNRNIERWLGEATTYMRHSVEETHERPHEAALGLPLFAEEQHVVGGEYRDADFGNHRVVVPDDTGEQRVTALEDFQIVVA